MISHRRQSVVQFDCLPIGANIAPLSVLQLKMVVTDLDSMKMLNSKFSHCAPEILLFDTVVNDGFRKWSGHMDMESIPHFGMMESVERNRVFNNHTTENTIPSYRNKWGILSMFVIMFAIWQFTDKTNITSQVNMLLK